MVKGKVLLKPFLSSMIILGMMPAMLFAASFDCSKVKTKIEKTICKNPYLSVLDENLAAAFSEILETVDGDSVKKTQRMWLKKTLYPCGENKECIKRAYEGRLNELGYGSNGTKKVPRALKCPQCGIWEVANDGKLLIIDEKRIIYPGCGEFTYKTQKITLKLEREDRYEYEVSMLLKQVKTSFLCNKEKDEGNDWYLEATVQGHFREGSIGSFALRKKKASEEATLWLRGWNMDREDPCDSGSGHGAAWCAEIEQSHIYGSLSNKAQEAYYLLLDSNAGKLPEFNAARFSAVVGQFCTEYHKESGGGSWPHAWAAGCQNAILNKKYDEFVAWQSCMEKNENKSASCKFPDENFDRTQEDEGGE